jgi:hypothetical protein
MPFAVEHASVIAQVYWRSAPQLPALGSNRLKLSSPNNGIALTMLVCERTVKMSDRSAVGFCEIRIVPEI